MKKNKKFSAIPDPQDLIVYYVTQVLGLPIWSDTELEVFNTYKWIEWLKANNLPPIYNILFDGGTLKGRYNKNLPDGLQVHPTDNLIKCVDTWIEVQRNSRKRNYEKISHEFRKWIYS